MAELPSFNIRGVLPKGLHTCTASEFIERYCYDSTEGGGWGNPDSRMSYKPVLEQLFGHSRQRGAKSIVFGGSFITDIPRPDDIDCLVILPNERCIPTKNEIFVLSGCKLDIIYAVEDNRSLVYRVMNMFAKDRYELEVGLVEVTLVDELNSSWHDFLSKYDFSELLQERESYINRHVILGNKPKGIFVSIHGINSHGEWNHEAAPIISSNNWIFAPFYYGYELTAIIRGNQKNRVLTKFRSWINGIYNKYQIKPSIFAHSFGTYIIGQYISGFDYNPPVAIENIILAGSILNEDFDWITGFENGCINTVLNIISPNDSIVPLIRQIQWLKNDNLYGTAGVNGFSQQHPRLFSDTFNIFDHSNMLEVDMFEKKIIPYLNLVKSIEKSRD